jgi:hypothetical protein
MLKICQSPALEIRRSVVPNQWGQIVCETLSRKTHHKKKGWWSGSRCKPWVQAPVLQKKKQEKDFQKKDLTSNSKGNINVIASFSLRRPLHPV